MSDRDDGDGQKTAFHDKSLIGTQHGKGKEDDSEACGVAIWERKDVKEMGYNKRTLERLTQDQNASCNYVGYLCLRRATVLNMSNHRILQASPTA